MSARLEMKSVTELTPEDLTQFPLWRFVNCDLADDTAVEPLPTHEVGSLADLLIGTQVRLANGSSWLALIGNIDHLNPATIEHFLTLSVWNRKSWLHLARYHDFAHETEGPPGFCAALGLSIDEVFPIRYDLRQHVADKASVLCGEIPTQPRTRLSRAELISMSV